MNSDHLPPPPLPLGVCSMKSSLLLMMTSLWPVFCQNMSLRSPKSLHGTKDIGCMPIEAKNYTGNASTTWTGLTCQMWSVDSPHEHRFNDVGEHNYCRSPNPQILSAVWCYTTDPNKRWDYCKVPRCGTQGKKQILPAYFCPPLKKKIEVLFFSCLEL